ncbi:MAG TPA: AAA family ATPase [Leptospiraceae bacterium]|nr:AAA family ATPase [Leptospiraceae bacterium]
MSSQEISLEIGCIRIYLQNENELLIPLTPFGDDLFLNRDSDFYFREVQKSIEKNVSENGMDSYQDLVSLTSFHEVQKDKITVSMSKSDSAMIYDDYIMKFDIYYWTVFDRKIRGKTVFPSVQSVASSKAELLSKLQNSLKLKLSMNGISDSLSLLIPYISAERTEFVSGKIKLKLLQNEDKEKEKENLAVKILEPVSFSKGSLFGMEEEWDEISEVFSLEKPESFLAVGPRGCGKTKLITEFIKSFTDKNDEAVFFRQTSAPALIQNLTEGSGWESRLGELAKDMHSMNAVLYLGRWSDYFEIGRYIGNSVSVGEALKDFVNKGRMTVISECTEEEFAYIEQRYPGAAAGFHILRMKKRSTEELIGITENCVKEFIKDQNISINTSDITEIFRLHRRFFPYSGLPGKVIRFFDSVIQNRTDLLTRHHFIQAFCTESDIPNFIIDAEIPAKEDEILNFFGERVFGQNAAVRSITDIILSVKAGLSSENKPIASLLFAGQTGVGKTESAKALAEFLFGSPDKMIRLDMSEYSDPYNVLRIAEDFSGSSSLVSRVRQNSFSVVLFDEIEKADSSFFDLLLQILGEGRLTNSKGETANFCSSIIIMTSNLGAAEASRNSPGFDREEDGKEIEDNYKKTIETRFRYELINRFDRIIVFSRLTEKHRIPIINREIEKVLSRRGITGKKIIPDVSESAVKNISETVSEKKYGAREIKRAVHGRITVPLSKMMNSGTAQQKVRLSIEIKEGKTVFSAESTQQKAGISGQEKFREILEKATDIRRTAVRISKGKIISELINEIFIREDEAKELLEKLQSAQKSDFYRQKFNDSKRLLSEMKSMQNDLNRIIEEVSEIERNLILKYSGENSEYANSNSELKRMESEIFSLGKKVYSFKNDDKKCCMVIYCRTVLMKYMFRLYSALFASAGLSFSCRAEDKTVYSSSTASDLTKFQAYVEGKEIKIIVFNITGLCPNLLLESEKIFEETGTEDSPVKGYIDIVSRWTETEKKQVKLIRDADRDIFFKTLPEGRKYSFKQNEFTDIGMKNPISLRNFSSWMTDRMNQKLLERLET